MMRDRIEALKDNGLYGTLRTPQQYPPTSVFAVWRDRERDLREALKFYADEKNYQHGWPGDQDSSPIDSDNGKKARQALRKR